MTKLEQILRQPNAGEQIVRAVIAASPGKETVVPVTADGKRYIVRTTVLKQVGQKLVKP